MWKSSYKQKKQTGKIGWVIIYFSHSVLLAYIPIVLKTFSYELSNALINIILNPLFSF